MEILQDWELTEFAIAQRRELRRRWATAGRQELRHIAEEMARHRCCGAAGAYGGCSATAGDLFACLSFDAFHGTAALVGSRVMVLEGGQKFLVPLADMINYAPRPPSSSGGTAERFAVYAD